jgi:hypothetical protein
MKYPRCRVIRRDPDTDLAGIFNTIGEWKKVQSKTPGSTSRQRELS